MNITTVWKILSTNFEKSDSVSYASQSILQIWQKYKEDWTKPTQQ